MDSMQIQRLLHHRQPYLLIDSVKKIEENSILAIKTLNIEEYYFKGHFPGAPVLPGAMMQEMTTQTAGVLLTKYFSPVADYDSETTKGHAIGVLKKINYARYKGFAKPGDKIEIKAKLIEKLDNLFEFKGEIRKDESVIMKNSFQLVNISDKSLY